MVSALVVGCYEFIGFELTKKLLEEDATVVGVQTNSNEEEVLAEFKMLEIGRHANFHVVNHDWQKEELPKSLSVVFYCASVMEDHDEQDLKTYLTIAEEKNAMFIFCSSLDVFDGYQEKETITEETEPTPGSTFAVRMAKAEQIIFQWNQKKIRYIIMRFPGLYGPWQPATMSFHRALMGESGCQFSESCTGDMIYIEDAVEAIWKACNAKIKNEIIHISSGKKNQWEAGMKRINKGHSFKEDKIVKYVSTKKAQEMLGFHPKTCMEAGIKNQREFINYLQVLESLHLED